MARRTKHAVLGLTLSGSLALAGCVNSPAPPSPAEPIAAEQDCWTSARVVPPQVMAKGRGAQQHAARSGDARGPSHAESCPMRVADTTVKSDAVPEGVALSFTTFGDVAELRQRVRQLAFTHAHDGVASDQHGCGCPLVGNDGVPLMAEASTSAQPLPRGARLVLTPNERNEVPRLRARVSERLGRLAANSCPVLDELFSPQGGTARR